MRGTDYAELTAFVAVAEQGGFAKAAGQLGIAPSTLSQTIRSLEERLGVRLLNRTTRSVALTDAGERLLDDLKPALDGVGRAVEGVNAFRDKPKGTLRLLVGRAVGCAAISTLAAPFMRQYPEITLEITSDDARIDIVSGRFDAGIRIGERIERDMIAVRLADEFQMMAVASPAYLAGRPRPQEPADLQGHACIRFRQAWDGAIHAWEFVREGERIEIGADGPLIVNDMLMVLDAARAGVGIAYLPQRMVAADLAEGRLVQLLGDWCLTMSGVFLYYPSRRQTPAPLQALIDFVRRGGPYG